MYSQVNNGLLAAPRGKEGLFPLHLAGRKTEAAIHQSGKLAEAQSRGNTAAKVFDTTGLLKLPGGLNKNHPAADEIRKAVEFYEDILWRYVKKDTGHRHSMVQKSPSGI